MRMNRIQPGPYLKLLMLAAVLGLISAIITFVFQGLVHEGQVLVWQRAERTAGLSAPMFTLAVCVLGGLAVGVLVRIFGDHSGIFAEMMTEFGRTGRFNYRNAPGMVITALASLIAGTMYVQSVCGATASAYCGSVANPYAANRRLNALMSSVRILAEIEGSL